MKLFAIGLLFQLTCSALTYGQKSVNAENDAYRFVFYNCENYFDPFVDSTTSYNEFTPEGERHWTYNRFETKRAHIFKVIAALGGWSWPAVVGFAEIENGFVLGDLLKNTPLSDAGYKVLHYESGDHRGIDVGMIYRYKVVKILYSHPFPLYDEAGKKMATRDILYVKILLSGDTLHLFINHWPSRYGGLLQSAPSREIAAKTLLHLTDSICMAVEQPAILIMGDFNDDPDDESIQYLTDANHSCRLYSLEELPDGYPVKGTLKYQADWNRFDQVIVSGSLKENHTGMVIMGKKAHIFCPDFLLVNDERYLDKKPNRTYNGFKYHGGFSDHLPVYIDLSFVNKK